MAAVLAELSLPKTRLVRRFRNRAVPSRLHMIAELHRPARLCLRHARENHDRGFLPWNASGISALFWLIGEATPFGVHPVLGPSSSASVNRLLSQTVMEILIWIVTSITAGVCEEIVVRGYVQRQFHPLTGSTAVAVLAQARVFGVFHLYQG